MHINECIRSSYILYTHPTSHRVRHSSRDASLHHATCRPSGPDGSFTTHKRAVTLFFSNFAPVPANFAQLSRKKELSHENCSVTAVLLHSRLASCAPTSRDCRITSKLCLVHTCHCHCPVCRYWNHASRSHARSSASHCWQGVPPKCWAPAGCLQK